MMPFEFTETEWQGFTKSERRIISLIRAHGYTRDQVCASLEIQNSTFRTHIAKIRRKIAEYNRVRNVAETKRLQELSKDRNEQLTPIDQPLEKPVAKEPLPENTLGDEYERMMREGVPPPHAHLQSQERLEDQERSGNIPDEKESGGTVSGGGSQQAS